MAAKIFEVGDVLPATTQLRISWSGILYDFVFSVDTDNGNFNLVYEDGMIAYVDDIAIYDSDDGTWISPYNNTDHAYVDINTSTWNGSKRTISFYGGEENPNAKLFWEDLNPPQGYSITFEENGGSTVTDLTEQTALPSPLPTTTKANHVFAGWYYDNLFTQKANAGDELTTNVTLYAKWYTPTTWCEDIADAIREKEGSSDLIKHVDFADRIEALPSPKEEETKTVTPNFASGNQVIIPTSGKVLSQVTLTKPTDLLPENIAKDKNVCGVVGTSFIAIELTQTQYDALGTKDANTYYLIVEE